MKEGGFKFGELSVMIGGNTGTYTFNSQKTGRALRKPPRPMSEQDQMWNILSTPTSNKPVKKTYVYDIETQLVPIVYV